MEVVGTALPSERRLKCNESLNPNLRTQRWSKTSQSSTIFSLQMILPLIATLRNPRLQHHPEGCPRIYSTSAHLSKRRLRLLLLLLQLQHLTLLVTQSLVEEMYSQHSSSHSLNLLPSLVHHSSQTSVAHLEPSSR